MVNVYASMVGHRHRVKQVARREDLATNASVDVSVRTVHTVTQGMDHAFALMAIKA